jgi:nucleoside-diphosphate-sugar epimerase
MKAIKWRKLLITGSTGFVGANLVRRFLKIGAEVYIITRKTSDKWRIKNVLKDVNEYCVDLLDYKKLESIILDIRPEIIFHTAIYGGYPFQKDIKRIIESNFIGTVNLVNACKKVDFELFVNTGSSSEYGIKSKSMTEEDILEPVNGYGVSKAAATLYCQAIARREKIPVVTLRFFSPYGYYEEATRLIPSVIISCLRGRNPEVSSPNSVRDFIFIEDVIDAYMDVIKTSDIGSKIFNIGYGEQHSVREVVNMIVELTGNNVRPEWGSVPKRAIEPNVWQADITKAKDVFKWEPKYSLEKGLAKTVKWFMENMNLDDKRQKENKIR